MHAHAVNIHGTNIEVLTHDWKLKYLDQNRSPAPHQLRVGKLYTGTAQMKRRLRFCNLNTAGTWTHRSNETSTQHHANEDDNGCHQHTSTPPISSTVQSAQLPYLTHRPTRTITSTPPPPSTRTTLRFQRYTTPPRPQPNKPTTYGTRSLTHTITQ